MQTIQTLARQMADALVESPRDDGSTYVHISNGRPWMTDVIHAAHGDMLPEDTRYRMIREVCEALAEVDADTEADDIEVYAVVAPLVDIYNAELTAWMASSLNRLGYVNDALDEYEGGHAGVIGLIAIGQQKEYEEIAFALVGAFMGRIRDTAADEVVDDVIANDPRP